MAQDENLISFGKYISGLLGYIFSWRPNLIKALVGIVALDKSGLSWGALLEENARKYPENMAVKSEEGNYTYREYNDLVNRYANLFIKQGLKKGDTAVVFMENRPELLIVYSAAAKVGAVNSMINTNLREKSLTHAVNLNPGKFIIVGEEMIDPFMEVKSDIEQLDGRKFFFVEDREQGSAPDGFIDLKEAIKDSPSENPSTTKEVKPSDTIGYVFTSGTTGGKPKAAVITHKRAIGSMYMNGMVVLNMKPSDTMYVPLPFFHTNALLLSWPTCLAAGSALAIRRRFSASGFLEDVRKFKATAFCYVGEVCRYLMNQPEKPDDAENPLEKIIGNGLRPDIWKEFKKRFGIDKVFEIYSAAESNLLFVNILNLDCTVGTCLTPYAIVKYDAETEWPVRDGQGFMQRVEKGGTGLCISKITMLSPFAGYTSREETESKLFRDVFEKGDSWFNCGDLLMDIGYRHAQFVDRLGDTFRWKGENVSTTEVEEVANRFGQVEESTVYGVLMPGGDGRIGMASIIANTRLEDFDFKGLAGLFQKALPKYAVPRFIRFKSEFDKTATYKAKKYVLKQEGFDLDRVKDPVYVLLPGESEYKPFTAEIFQEIQKGKYRF